MLAARTEADSGCNVTVRAIRSRKLQQIRCKRSSPFQQIQVLRVLLLGGGGVTNRLALVSETVQEKRCKFQRGSTLRKGFGALARRLHPNGDEGNGRPR